MWKTIEGFDNYEVSDAGEVRNTKYNRLLTPSQGAGGYLRVNLRKDKKSHQQYVHRLVASAFLEGEGEVNHLNGNRADNRVENLEWTSHQQNIQHAHTVLNRTPSRGRVRIRVEHINGEVYEFNTVKECAAHYQVDVTTIRDYIEHKLTPHRKVQANFYYI
jgi:hypothetical protein